MITKYENNVIYYLKLGIISKNKKNKLAFIFYYQIYNIIKYNKYLGDDIISLIYKII